MNQSDLPEIPTFTVLNDFLPGMLKSREDDFRMVLLADVLYSDEFRNDTFGETVPFRKAATGDTVQYAMINDPSQMRMAIETNIVNLSKLKGSRNHRPIENVWIVVFEYDEEASGIRTSAYRNPDAADCSSIIRGDKQVSACFFIIEYSALTVGVPDGEEPVSSINWIMISPGDASKLEEYTAMYRENYAKTLKSAFFIEFKSL